MRSRFLLLAAVGGFTGVAMGAFGAHALKHSLTDVLTETYKTAVHYQLIHSLALGLIAVLPADRRLRWAGWCMTFGIVLFSGSLYLLAIFNLKPLGMITPFGGMAFLAGWSLLAWFAYQSPEH